VSVQPRRLSGPDTLLPIRPAIAELPPARAARVRPPATRTVLACAGLLALGATADLPGIGLQVLHAASAAEGHEETIWDLLARVLNFSILAGTLVLLLRRPLATYLDTRSRQIRSDLVNAAETRRVATEQLAEIERQLAGLPAELEALKARGRDEVAAEEVRIRQAAGAERERLLAQVRREIDLQVRIARKELLLEAADLAVAAATSRVRQTITPADQTRLLDRYVTQVTSTNARG
jgi:F0F1-type ATP synthase membrane subunit b/b'